MRLFSLLLYLHQILRLAPLVQHILSCKYEYMYMDLQEWFIDLLITTEKMQLFFIIYF